MPGSGWGAYVKVNMPGSGWGAYFKVNVPGSGWGAYVFLLSVNCVNCLELRNVKYNEENGCGSE
jgi:hypothetical protein